MRYLNARVFRSEYMYRKMVGDKDITPEEAYKIFYMFLKRYKYMGVFLRKMRDEFGVNAQMYRVYFINRIKTYQAHANKFNNFTYHRPVYYWCEDIHLFFPFLPIENETYLTTWYKYWTELHEFWKLFCQENKLMTSQILLKSNDNEENISDTRCAWEGVLEECGFPP